MNRILYAADCLAVLDNADELPDESVDLIYLDPPFNSNSNYNLPFRGRDKSLKPVEAFKDTWEWQPEDSGRLEALEADPRTRSLATIIKFAEGVEGKGSGRGKKKTSLASYLLHMALRLRAMRRVLKKTGSIYLHCDPTAGHYLKLVLDSVFGVRNFITEIIWNYGTPSGGRTSGKKPVKTHENIFAYAKSYGSHIYNRQYTPYSEKYINNWFRHADEQGRMYQTRSRGGKIVRQYLDQSPGVPLSNTWTDIKQLYGSSGWFPGNREEILGYPTQKPLALLERIIRASSNRGDLVLDPFCGCGTTVHAAEALGRRWIGIDISPFSTGLIRERIAHNFPQLGKSDISIRGIPETIEQARALARRDKFEFEKWVCGFVGAEGMFRQPGERGADGGVDGLLKFYRFAPKKVAKAEYAVVQVKGGKVSPDAVRALRETVDRLGVTAGVLVCFAQYMRTVENQRSRDAFTDVFGSYPIIQGYSVENLLANEPLDLPTYGRRRQGALLDL